MSGEIRVFERDLSDAVAATVRQPGLIWRLGLTVHAIAQADKVVLERHDGCEWILKNRYGPATPIDYFP